MRAFAMSSRKKFVVCSLQVDDRGRRLGIKFANVGDVDLGKGADDVSLPIGECRETSDEKHIH